MFGIGRNSIREAVRIMKAYGIVESRQKVGTIITDKRWDAMLNLYSFGFDISADVFVDVQGFRRLIEINIFDDIVARIDGPTIEELKRLNEEMRDADDVQAAELDFQFHRTLIQTAGNHTVLDVYSLMRPIIVRLMQLGKKVRTAVDGTYLEHLEIITAIGDNDRIAYTYHMGRHLKAGLRFAPAPRPQQFRNRTISRRPE